jgi:hypothetical protein
MELNGVFEKNYVRGELVFDCKKGVVVKKGYGKHIRPA